ncbi:GNAT family N-acetyltransferase [Bacillus luteolus]|uniref:GNAT family N-acetyltransferase n=1 Tax=Litchfieldia luteola TaxID=682179 RepID=A0ABR9QGD0_9BACI|nr:GNAT family N-acetyltransferase [Cytobacillus luteolus]MBE4907557.1 GNAT family N-acetyltransferase [Cytobacillus luteolus]MBP1944330.1 ribosomal protein S18 acetylase RimI-like enzyme [Cytobacillus luteolus]
MEIRILNSSDAEAYRKIRLHALQGNPEAFSSSYEEEVEYPLERTASRLDEGTSFTFGAFIDNTLVGVVSLVLETRHKIKHRATIFAMYVNPDHRKLGVGKQLMVAAIEEAQKLDEIEQIYLTVNASNEPAKRLYLSLGFKTYGVDKRALKIEDQYYDEELMVLVK